MDRLSLFVPLLLVSLIPLQPAASQNLLPGRERITGADVFRGSVQAPGGYALRTFITRPQHASGKLPVIFMVGWLSCDSVEQPNGPEDGFIQLLTDLASRSGFVTYRVDKPGVGESGGPACGETDFQTELAAYRAAFAGLGSIDFIDTSRIYILGFSNGGGFAPLVAEKTPVRGYLVYGGWYKTWLEHMLEHERRRLKFKGVPPADINLQMKAFATFYDLYLNGKQTPGAVIQQRPELKDIWYDKPGTQYGRPASFYHQLQALNLPQAWQQVSTPVLAVHGEYDWIMSGDDYRLLVSDLNARHPGTAEFVEWPRADHVLQTHQSAQKAFGSDPQKSYDPKLSDFTLRWLKQH